jgi:glycosyltransferase involved in cell wall biosynthesis
MKISIITTTYNSAKTIEETILSVLSQDYQNFEHIIVDGASKDNTMKIVKKYEDKYNGRLKYVSEPDKGIYDAMNKGIKMATGDVIGLLNSDDKYADTKILSKISNAIEINNCDGVHGNLLYMDYETMLKPQRKWITKSTNIKTGNIIAHPTLYLRKEVYDKMGLYNLKYKVVSDYDFMVRLLLNKEFSLMHIDEYLIYMRIGRSKLQWINSLHL